MSGNGTSLISLYIPAGGHIATYQTLVKQELATASNIKSKKVRHGVQSGLDMIRRKLKDYRTVPENGLAIFAGINESCI